MWSPAFLTTCVYFQWTSHKMFFMDVFHLYLVLTTCDWITQVILLLPCTCVTCVQGTMTFFLYQFPFFSNKSLVNAACTSVCLQFNQTPRLFIYHLFFTVPEVEVDCLWQVLSTAHEWPSSCKVPVLYLPVIFKSHEALKSLSLNCATRWPSRSKVEYRLFSMSRR